MAFNKLQRINITCQAISVTILLLTTFLSASTGNVRLKLELAKYEYVIREPLKFVVTLVNESDQTIRIPEASAFDMDMEFLNMEIITPDGEKQLRKFFFKISDELINPNYTGEPLLPGESFQTYFYPNTSYFVLPLEWGGITFPLPGTYQVRVYYSVPDVYKKLWRPEKNELYSNKVDMLFREPTFEEQEILDACWSAGGSFLSLGDDYDVANFNEDKLEYVADKYPDHPMIKYALFYLAKNYLYKSKTPDKSIPIFQELVENYHDYRFEEVHLHLGNNYLKAGSREEAIKTFNEALRKKPFLKDHFRFMCSKILSETSDTSKIGEWVNNRKHRKHENESKEENNE